MGARAPAYVPDENKAFCSLIMLLITSVMRVSACTCGSSHPGVVLWHTADGVTWSLLCMTGSI